MDSLSENENPPVTPSKDIIDSDYADDIALLSDQINNAETLLQSLETAAHKVDLPV